MCRSLCLKILHRTEHIIFCSVSTQKCAVHIVTSFGLFTFAVQNNGCANNTCKFIVWGFFNEGEAVDIYIILLYHVEYSNYVWAGDL